ncbi:hypothetical protein HPB49_010559 [Dermacentor silvarum]|uniref:Uncharacterized protein n=1 Tax=Dermacentor silvarum TaxID=543639 RepID=A0ACB8CWR6_DERSI|nr:hypothetical protein HPB49_010559 [Dermacentor silvarum]
MLVFIEYEVDMTTAVVTHSGVQNFNPQNVADFDPIVPYDVWWNGDETTAGGYYKARVLHIAELGQHKQERKELMAQLEQLKKDAAEAAGRLHEKVLELEAKNSRLQDCLTSKVFATGETVHHVGRLEKVPSVSETDGCCATRRLTRCWTQAGTDEHSAMTSQGVTPGQKRQLICTSQPDCKRQDTGDSEDESRIIEDDNVANLSDLDMDEGGFRVVRHRKDRAEGIPVLITAASERADLRQVNPILLYSELEAILGGAPVKSRFTAQGALLLDPIRKPDDGGTGVSGREICARADDRCHKMATRPPRKRSMLRLLGGAGNQANRLV